MRSTPMTMESLSRPELSGLLEMQSLYHDKIVTLTQNVPLIEIGRKLVTWRLDCDNLRFQSTAKRCYFGKG